MQGMVQNEQIIHPVRNLVLVLVLFLCYDWGKQLIDFFFQIYKYQYVLFDDLISLISKILTKPEPKDCYK